MSRLLALGLARASNSAILFRSLSSSKTSSSKLIVNSSSSKSLNQLLSRALASKAHATNQHVSGPKSEADKQQWEREDRYKIFYGFDFNNEAADKAVAHFYTFLCFFGFFFIPGFLIYYFPDYRQNEWCYREAHLELARREKLGVDLVSPDYIPVENIKLPSDEELGDMEIVI